MAKKQVNAHFPGIGEVAISQEKADQILRLQKDIQRQRDEAMAERIIQKLLDAGYTYDTMIPVIKMAQHKYKELFDKANSNSQAV